MKTIKKIKGYVDYLILRLYVIFTIKMWSVQESIEETMNDVKKYLKFGQ